MTAISDLWSHWLSPLTNSRFIPPTENTPGSSYLPPLKSREPFSTWWGSHWSLRFVLPSLSFTATEPDGDGNGGSSRQEDSRFWLLWPKIFQTSVFLRLFYTFGKFPECLKWLILLVLSSFIDILKGEELPVSSFVSCWIHNRLWYIQLMKEHVGTEKDDFAPDSLTFFPWEHKWKRWISKVKRRVCECVCMCAVQSWMPGEPFTEVLMGVRFQATFFVLFFILLEFSACCICYCLF